MVSSPLRARLALSVVGVAVLGSLALLVLAMVYSKHVWLVEFKNWTLVAVSVLGIFASLRRRSLTAHPYWAVATILLFVLLAYVSLQDIVSPGYVFGLTSVSATTPQLAILLVAVAPLLVRLAGLRLPDAASVVLRPARSRSPGASRRR